MSSTQIYSAYSKDAVLRSKSSSGGIFSLIAEMVIKEGGIVYGAVYDENFHVVHKGVDSLDGLDALRGSKYVQSKLTRDVTNDIKENLQKGRNVLFCGTPCQTEGVIRFVGEDLRKNLIAVDFTCHGTPAPEVWDAYLSVLKEKGDIASINMRDKRFGWKTYSMCVDYQDGSRFSEIFSWNHYSLAFLRDYSLRKPCYSCAFRGVRPNSDITLADSWGVSKEHPKMNDDRGISKVYVHTDAGRELFESVCGKMNYILDAEVKEYKTKEIYLNEPSKREAFFALIKSNGFEYAYKHCVDRGFIIEGLNMTKGLVKILLHYCH